MIDVTKNLEPFVTKMKQRFKEKEGKKFSYTSLDIYDAGTDLWYGLLVKVAKAHLCLHNVDGSLSVQDAKKHVVDIANFAAMLWTVLEEMEEAALQTASGNNNEVLKDG